MWAWGFFSQRLLPSVVVMATSYVIVLVVIKLFRVKSRNGRIALLLLPLWKSLFMLVIGTPIVRDNDWIIFFGMKFPDIDQLRIWQRTPDRYLPGFEPKVQSLGSLGVRWDSVFNAVFVVVVAATAAIVFFRLVRFATFYRRVSAGPDLVADRRLRDLPALAAKTMGISVPKLIAIDAPETFVPFTMGLRRPVVVLPERLLDRKFLTDAEIESVLAHEFAHIRRRDYLLNWVFSVADSLLFYNPLTKRIVSRAYEAAEEACDDLAVRTTGRPRALVDALMRIAHETAEGARKFEPRRTSVPSSVGAYTNTLMSGRHLKDRIVRIETGPVTGRPPFWLRVLRIAPLAVFVAFFSIVQFNLGFPLAGHMFILQ